ncbi:MAG: MarR family winged helix-turn-helix transcriptional regulator [Anaeroplasma sp.]
MDNKYRMLTKIVRNMKIKESRIEDGINDTEYEALRYIIKHENCIAKDVCEHLNVDKSLLTRIIKKLNDHCYIIIIESNEDKRKKYLQATEKGVNLKRLTQNFEIEYYQSIFKDVNEEEKKVFFEILEKVYLESKRLRKLQ